MTDTDVHDDDGGPEPDPIPDGAGDGDGDGDGVTAPVHRRTALVISLVVAVLVAAFVAVLATREPATDREVNSELVGRVAPAVKGDTLGGGTFDIDNHVGRWVVVNFFATWCRECVVEHPQLDSFEQDHAELGDAVVVSVLYDDAAGKASDFFAERGGDWPVVLDDGTIATRFGVTGVPETYLVAPSGRVAVKLIGGVTQEGLEEQMAAIDALATEDGS